MIDQILKCDRCGDIINDRTDENWGNCTECGDDICGQCSGGFNDDGICAKCVAKLQDAIIGSKGIPNMHSLSLHDVIKIDMQDRIIDGSQGRFLIKEYTFSGAGFRFTVNAFMLEVTI